MNVRLHFVIDAALLNGHVACLLQKADVWSVS
jgi:hypothetical protein